MGMSVMFRAALLCAPARSKSCFLGAETSIKVTRRGKAELALYSLAQECNLAPRTINAVLRWHTYATDPQNGHVEKEFLSIKRSIKKSCRARDKRDFIQLSLPTGLAGWTSKKVFIKCPLQVLINFFCGL